MRIKQLTMVVVAATFAMGLLSTHAEARGRRGSTWVPQGAWKAVKRFAKQKYNTQAKLFKTTDTKAVSLGLKGAHSTAWVVGAKAPQRQQPNQGFMPYQPRQAFFLVTKGENRRWEVTPLAGMGGRYLTKVDGRTGDARVGVGVGLFNAGQVGHGVEVSNATRVTVTKGKQLAAKRNDALTQTVFLKGATNAGFWANSAKGTLRASVIGGGWCGTPIPKNIPVDFNQVLFARPLVAGR
jgi:hypothetical protein